MSTPDSMQRVANRWRRSWCVMRFTPASLAAQSIDFLALENLHYGFFGKVSRLLPTHFFQQLLQAAVEWNPPVFAVFGDADVEQSFLEIHVTPQNVPGLIDPQAG